MRLSIGHKIFLAVFGTIGTLLMLVVIGQLITMTYGFARHVREFDDAWLGRVAASLRQSYQVRGDWSELPRASLDTWLQGQLGHQGGPMMMPGGPPPGGRFLFDPHGGPPGRPGGVPQDLLARVGVLDAQGQPVAGNTAGKERRPLLVSDRLVGYLTLEPFSISLTRMPPFLRDQLTRLGALAGVALLLSLMAASLLARNFRHPIRRLARATHRLASGDFSVRLRGSRGDELGDLVKDFNVLAKALESQSQARRRWVADTSHELRTPLAVLRAEVEALQDGIHQPDETTLGVLHTQVLALQKLVDDLHQLARSDEGLPAFDMTPIEVGGLLGQMVDSFQERFRRSDLDLRFRSPEGPVWVHGDPAQMRRLFGNLLENSLRYTDGPGCLELEVRVVAHRVLLTFEDTAPGVPPADLERLFERFYRVDASRSRERGGSGLGLAICQGIVEAHQGTLSARPSRLGGVCIEVDLPCPTTR